jgi:catechol 2,3-dioxygenase-like lactoylglutathione lyase family enzyme
MDQRVDFITLATAHLDTARDFYVGGLGWTPTLDVPGEILFFQVGRGLMLGLFDAVKFQDDLALHPRVGLESALAPPKISGVTLAHNVGSAAEVDALFERAVRARASVIKPPQPAAFGGYHAYVADPNGVIWELAYNPGWAVDPDGRVRLDAVSD